MSESPTSERETIGRSNLASACLLLALLWSVDAIFLSGDLWLRVTDGAKGHDMWLGTDRGHPEFFQYTKWIWIILLMLLLARVLRSKWLLIWLPILVFLLFDDALELHESLGWKLGDALPSKGLISSGDVGEALVLVSIGAIALTLLALGAANSPRNVREVFVDLTALIGFAALFGIIVDLIHGLLDGFAKTVSGILEESGEMFSISLVVAYLFFAVLRPGSATTPRVWIRVRERIVGTG